MDRRLTREKRTQLVSMINVLRQHAFVDVWETEDENAVLAHMQKEPYQVVFAPWFLYLKWTKVEGVFGLTRSAGPTFAGYFAEPIPLDALTELPAFQRLLLFDFAHTAPKEAALLVTALASDPKRMGIRALLQPGTPIFCETWNSAQTLGPRIDALAGLPALSEHGWLPRLPAIRSGLSALWSLVFQEGPGAVASPANQPRAYFQVAADAQTVTLRLFYPQKNAHIKKLIESFWPNRSLHQVSPHSAAQILLRDADFVRAQLVNETQDVEVTAVFFKSAAADVHAESARGLWIEPVHPSLVLEVPYETPGPDSPWLKTFGMASSSAPPSVVELEASRRKDRMLHEAADKMAALKRQLAERDRTLEELRMGGVGTAPPPPPPDAEALLEAFQHHYFEARHQIHQFTLQLADLESRQAAGAETAGEARVLKRRMDALAEREKAWIRQLASIIASYKQSRKAGSE